MKTKRVITTGIVAFTSMLIFISHEEANTFPTLLNNNTKEDSLKSAEKIDTPSNIIKGASIEMIKGRRGYDLGGRKIVTKHFAVRITKPDNPFGPHKHEQTELWFIVAGYGTVLLDGIEYEVEANDLIILDPWIEHGLSTTTEVTWICLG